MPAMPARRGMSGPWALAAVGACACVAVAIVDPTKHQMTPPCPFRALTGWWCPICGATRAASRLIRGDLGSAFHFNAMFVTLLPVAVVAWVAWAFPQRFPWLDPVRRRARPLLYAFAAIGVAFVVVRNTWAADWLRYPGA